MLTQKEVEKFKALLEKESDIKVTHQQAKESAENFYNLMLLIANPQESNPLDLN